MTALSQSAESAAQNLELINSQLASGGTCQLPPATIPVAGPPKLTSGCRLVGHEGRTVLRNTVGGPALNSFADGLGYTEIGHIVRPLEVDEYLYWFRYDGYWGPFGQCATLARVTSVVNGRPVTSPPMDREKHTAVLRFKKAWPCGTPAAGNQFVTLSPPDAPPAIGMTVFVTDGPSIANAGRGEFRKVAAVEGAKIWLDSPLRMNYGAAVLADINVIENVTVEGVRVESMPNDEHYTWTAIFKGHVGLKIQGVSFNGRSDIITSRDAVVQGCYDTPLQFNTATDCHVRGCRLPSFYAEEACRDIFVSDTTFGPVVGNNVITGYFAVEALKFFRVTVVGAGNLVYGWPASAFNLDGPDMTLRDITVAGSTGGGSYIGGNRLLIDGYNADSTLDVTSGSGAAISHVRSPYAHFRPNNAAGVLFDVENLAGGEGWTKIACVNWQAPRRTMLQTLGLQKTEVPKKAPKPLIGATLHDRLKRLLRPS